MRMVSSLALAFITCGLTWAQSGFSGSMSSVSGVLITFESRLEPDIPEMPNLGQMGIRSLGSKSEGMRRYATNTKTREYFGYNMKVEAIDDRAGSYRVTFSALTLTPEELGERDPGSWRRLPSPVFPPPQIVNTADSIVVDVFENSATRQKIVDYIRLKRDTCEAEGADSYQVSCLKSLVEDATRSLTGKLSAMKGTRDSATVASIKVSQQSWDKYREDACGNLASEVKRLQCELKLTRSRTHDLGVIY